MWRPGGVGLTNAYRDTPRKPGAAWATQGKCDGIHLNTETCMEAHPGRELRFYPVILQGDQLQLGDQLLQRER